MLCDLIMEVSQYISYPKNSEEEAVLLISREQTNLKNWDFHDCTQEIPRCKSNPSLIGLCVDRSNSSTV